MARLYGCDICKAVFDSESVCVVDGSIRGEGSFTNDSNKVLSLILLGEVHLIDLTPAKGDKPKKLSEPDICPVCTLKFLLNERETDWKVTYNSKVPYYTPSGEYKTAVKVKGKEWKNVEGYDDEYDEEDDTDEDEEDEDNEE